MREWRSRSSRRAFAPVGVVAALCGRARAFFSNSHKVCFLRRGEFLLLKSRAFRKDRPDLHPFPVD